MKKYVLLAVIIFLAKNKSFTQISDKITLKLGEIHSGSQQVFDAKAIGSDSTGIYTIRVQPKSSNMFKNQYNIEHYNQDMNFINSTVLDVSYNKKYRDVDLIFQPNKDSIYFLLSQFDKKSKIKNLTVQSLNKETLQLNSGIRKIAGLDFSKDQWFKSSRYTYKISRDSSKFLILYFLHKKKSEQENFSFHVYDKSFNLIWEKNVKLPYSDKLFKIYDYTIDNEGNVHLLGRKYKDINITDDYKYHILSYYKTNDDFKEYIIDVHEKFLTDMEITVNDNLDLICAGFYSELGETGYFNKGFKHIKGAYYLRINRETKKVEVQNFKEFDENLIKQNLTEKQKKKTDNKKEPELLFYNLHDLIIRDDGGVVLVGEQHYYKNYSYTFNNKTTYYEEHHYNDIIVININPEGEIEWAQKIPKRQKVAMGEWHSYYLTIVKDRLYFIFNDNHKNFDYTGEGKVYDWGNYSEWELILVELDRFGIQKKKVIITQKNSSVLFAPLHMSDIPGNELVMYGRYQFNYRFGKIEFHD